jgi:hypothetical protein
MKTLDVPGRPGETVTVKKLGWKVLRDAEDAMLQHAARLVRERGLSRQAIEQAFEEFGGKDAVRAAAIAMPWKRFDADVLIQRSVLSWNPPRPSPTAAAEPELVSWLAREILRLSAPHLFEEAAR